MTEGSCHLVDGIGQRVADKADGENGQNGPEGDEQRMLAHGGATGAARDKGRP